jgi:MoaA/NifB/PqqE/SkfB family radical SAM enzyme
MVSSIERALRENRLSPACVQAIVRILVQGLLIGQGDRSAAEAFQEVHGWRAPTFLVISPGKACNLRCKGCYVDSTDTTSALPWSTVDRIISEAKALWGTRFMVISGGEPFVLIVPKARGYSTSLKKHDDCLFMVYTNGTSSMRRWPSVPLVLETSSRHLAGGGRETTDARGARACSTGGHGHGGSRERAAVRVP